MRQNTTDSRNNISTLIEAVVAVTPPWLTLRATGELIAAWLALFAAVVATGLGLIALEPIFDAAVIDLVSEHRVDGAVTAARALTMLTQAYVIFPLIAVAGFLAARRGASVDVLWVPALAVGGGFAISVFIKFVVARPRPDLELSAVEAFGPAFPSGHVIRATAFAGAVAWLVTRSRPRIAPLVWPLAFALPGVVAVGRVYQGAHWPTDVLVGALVGIVWLAVVVRVAVAGSDLGDDQSDTADQATTDPAPTDPATADSRTADQGTGAPSPAAPPSATDPQGEPTGA